jgi:cytochrome bd-type quinol oxidase subunit 2
VHEAVSPYNSLLFMTIALVVLIPIIITYQSYSYWIFHGKLDVAQEASPT